MAERSDDDAVLSTERRLELALAAAGFANPEVTRTRAHGANRLKIRAYTDQPGD